MTGPSNPPPPGGPGRLADEDYALQLATVGADVIGPLAEALAATAPPFTAEQRTTLTRIFGGGPAVSAERRGAPPPSKPPKKPINTRPIGKPPSTGR